MTDVAAKRIALSLGDPNGIGPEIALRALDALQHDAKLAVTVFGVPEVLERAAQVTGLRHLLKSLAVETAGSLPAAGRALRRRQRGWRRLCGGIGNSGHSGLPGRQVRRGRGRSAP